MDDGRDLADALGVDRADDVGAGAEVVEECAKVGVGWRAHVSQFVAVSDRVNDA